MTDSTTPEPWAQREGEPARAYERFLAWLHLNGARTNTAAAELCGCSEATIRANSVAWSWRSRAAAWDRHRLPKLSGHLQNAAENKHRAALETFRDSQQRTADAMSACAYLMLKLCVKSLKKARDDGMTIPPATLANIASTAGRLLEQSGNSTGVLLGLDELSAAMGLDDEDRPRPALPGSDPESLAALEEIVSEAEAAS